MAPPNPPEIPLSNCLSFRKCAITAPFRTTRNSRYELRRFLDPDALGCRFAEKSRSRQLTARMTNEQRQLECRLQSLRPEFASGRRESLALAPQAFTRRCANRVVRPVRRVDTSSSASHLAECEGIMLGPVRALARRPERSPFTLSREAVAIVCRQHFQIPARQRARVSFRRRVSAELDDRVLCETVMS